MGLTENNTDAPEENGFLQAEGEIGPGRLLIQFMARRIAERIVMESKATNEDQIISHEENGEARRTERMNMHNGANEG